MMSTIFANPFFLAGAGFAVGLAIAIGGVVALMVKLMFNGKGQATAIIGTCAGHSGLVASIKNLEQDRQQVLLNLKDMEGRLNGKIDGMEGRVMDRICYLEKRINHLNGS